MKRVSIVIPTYNGARFIAAALDSVRRQTFAPLEVIVVDDCSTDETVAIVRDLCSHELPPLRVVELSRNSGGPALPINRGVAEASGELVLVLDQDDILDVRSLECGARIFVENPALVCVAGVCGLLATGDPHEWAAARLAELRAAGSKREGFFELPGRVVLDRLIEHNNFFIGWPCFMFQRALFQRKGGTDESLRIAPDLEFLLWLAMVGNVGLSDQVWYYRREHDMNVCRNRLQMAAEAFRVRCRYSAHVSRGLRRARRLELAEEGRAISYKLRQSGKHAEAIGILANTLRAEPISRETAVALLKVVVHWFIAVSGFSPLAGEVR